MSLAVQSGRAVVRREISSSTLDSAASRAATPNRFQARRRRPVAAVDTGSAKLDRRGQSGADQSDPADQTA